jgi:hypothetical protein
VPVPVPASAPKFHVVTLSTAVTLSNFHAVILSNVVRVLEYLLVRTMCVPTFVFYFRSSSNSFSFCFTGMHACRFMVIGFHISVAATAA